LSRRLLAGFAAIVIALIALGLLSQSSEDGPLVLAASSLQESMEAAADAWERKGHPRPVLSFAGTAALARQVEAGAAADLFVSADEAWMDELAGSHLIRHETRTSFLTNRLVIIAPDASDVELDAVPGMPIRAALHGGKLAMADPDAVPAGRYARQSLVSLGVWPRVTNDIARTDSVRQALALVTQADAPLGIVYATDARAQPNVRVVVWLPETSHAPISYPVAVLASSTHDDAEAFRQFLLSDEAKAIFRSFGFGAP
jgi:molybdate transport system substrate-binding protein